MRSLEELDRFIGGIVKRWAARLSGGEQAPALLEIRKGVLEEVRRAIEPLGGGEYLFPFNEVLVRIAAPESGRRGLYESAFVEAGSLDGDIRALLADAGARTPDLRVEVQIAEGPEGKPFEVACVRRPRQEQSGEMPAAKIVVLQGDAEEPQVEIHAARTYIGRNREVLGATGGLRRRNDLAFADSEKTVSREHASIEYDASSGKFRLYDSMSQRGTAIVRDGRLLQVPRGDQRGVQLQDGDEIHLGSARLRFEVSPAPV
jgi:hypothetical protein